jgi:hypothetical protein
MKYLSLIQVEKRRETVDPDRSEVSVWSELLGAAKTCLEDITGTFFSF